MRKSELHRLIHEEISNINFDYLLNNFSNLYNCHQDVFQHVGLRLLKEYSINLDDVYQTSPVDTRTVTGYRFVDSNGDKHLTLIQRGSDTVKMGPALIDTPIEARIDFNSRLKNSDDKILSTHISNIFKIVNDNNLKTISFEPADDKYKDARKRLFTNILKRYQDKIENIETIGDMTKIKLK